MSLQKQGEKARNGGAANRNLPLMKMVVWSFFINRAAAVDISGFVFSGACRDQSAYICTGMGAASCCGFAGLQQIRSILYSGVPSGDSAYAWRPNDGDPSCGDIQQSQVSGGQQFCLRGGTFGLTGGSWARGGPPPLLSEDGEPVAAPKCDKVVKPTLMRLNVSDNLWYPVHDRNNTST